MNLIPISFQNLWRNRRRTISTVIAILIGVSLIVFVNGFNDGFTEAYSRDLIDTWRAHFILRHTEYADHASTDTESILIEDPQALIEELKKNPHIVEVMAGVDIRGLIGQEHKSTSFFGTAYDVNKIDTVLPEHDKYLVEGQKLSPEDPYGAILGKALAESLGIKIGDELVVLANSVYQESTAIVVNARGFIKLNGARSIEQSLIITDLEQVQYDLLDIENGTTQLYVRIDDNKNLRSVTQWVDEHFQQRGEPWVAFPWYDDRQFSQATGLFNGIGFIIGVIMALIVSVVISESLLMSIVERIREIGSLRAIGAGKSHIYKIFYFEAIITTLIGTFLGVMFGIILVEIASYIGIPIPQDEGDYGRVFPMITSSGLLTSSLIPMAVTLISVWFPIRMSCKMDIVDAVNYR